jgi:hypothetical protein
MTLWYRVCRDGVAGTFAVTEMHVQIPDCDQLPFLRLSTREEGVRLIVSVLAYDLVPPKQNHLRVSPILTRSAFVTTHHLFLQLVSLNP